jgi:hypothetical protein
MTHALFVTHDFTLHIFSRCIRPVSFFIHELLRYDTFRFSLYLMTTIYHKYKMSVFSITDVGLLIIILFTTRCNVKSWVGKNLRHPREIFLFFNEAPPSWRPIEIFPAGIWDFFVLPSYGCLILFLTNLPILYVFRCFILLILHLSLRLTFSHPFLPCQCLFPLSKK